MFFLGLWTSPIKYTCRIVRDIKLRWKWMNRSLELSYNCARQNTKFRVFWPPRVKLYFQSKERWFASAPAVEEQSTPSVSKALRIIIFTFVYTSIVGIMNTRGDMWTIYKNLHSFHFVFAKAVLLRCPAKLGSPWLMMPFQLEKDGPGTTTSFWFTRLRKSILHSGETSVENIYWKLVRDFLFALHLMLETWLVLKRKRYLDWKMSWSCTAIEGAVVVFSRLLLCRVSKHSKISIHFQYLTRKGWFQLDRPVLDLTTEGSRLWCCQNCILDTVWAVVCSIVPALQDRSMYGPT